MSSNASAADRLSLSLPDWRTALKRRVRRPKRPDGSRLYFLGCSVLFAIQAVVSLVSSAPMINTLVELEGAGFFWSAAHKVTNGHKYLNYLKFQCAYTVVIIVVCVVFAV